MILRSRGTVNIKAFGNPNRVFIECPRVISAYGKDQRGRSPAQ